MLHSQSRSKRLNREAFVEKLWSVKLLLGSSIAIASVLSLGTSIVNAQTLEKSTIDAEIPEEVLQTEIILDARSPLDGEPLTAAEFAELQAALGPAVEDVPARLSPRVHRLAVLLRLRKLLSTFLPFLF